MRIFELPTELLSLILTFLDQSDCYACALVSKQFYAASIPVLWRAPVLHHSALAQFFHCLEQAQPKLGTFVRLFRIDSPYVLDDRTCLLLLRSVPNLETLLIYESQDLTDKSLSQLSRYCPQLEELYLDGVNISYRSIHHLSLCRHLRKLTLQSCPNLLPITLFPLANCPIEYLDIASSRWLDAENTAFDLRSFHHLTHLDVVCCRSVCSRFLHHISTPHEDGTMPLANLRYFSVGGSDDIDDEALITFVQSHARLEQLTILMCAVTDLSLGAIQRLSNLRHLDISYCVGVTANGVRQVVHACPLLEMIGLKNTGILKTDFPEVDFSQQQPWSMGPLIDRLEIEQVESVRVASIPWLTQPQPVSALSSPPPLHPPTAADEPEGVMANFITENFQYIQDYLDAVAPSS
ncbi:uncharacterized protein BYT42DRAFT_561878 [Radiomyces spectabilis]|uniref:uncharacterized protein n=1 Tax=Radiomyces spectabilis TaxID=64574 RepID=UPI00221F1572|nr:uncharacterized protein BYT42DRAFT_561878 [Radiomyces spectabilis]KAI8384248.1 hypothetical protein BYT42DRAFT_561878 [Radiomyces spectabilis]